MNQKTVPSVIKINIANAYQMDLIGKLTNSKFEIHFDETTDVSQVHNACIIFIFVDFEQRKIVTSLWEIISTLDEFDKNHQVNADRLYQLIKDSFTTRKFQ